MPCVVSLGNERSARASAVSAANEVQAGEREEHRCRKEHRGQTSDVLEQCARGGAHHESAQECAVAKFPVTCDVNRPPSPRYPVASTKPPTKPRRAAVKRSDRFTSHRQGAGT